jgi:predicted porin
MRHFSLIIASSTLALSAAAQSGAPIEAELDVTTAFVIAPIRDDDGLAETETVLGEIALSGKAEKVLENGVRIRGRMDLRLQRDNKARPGSTGGFGIGSAPTGAFSGLSSGAPIGESDTRVRLETAYLQVDGGYGEVRIGKDQGVAARFHEGSENVLTYARLDSALLDPSGLSTVRTRHDLTGPSLKVSYATPRILGLRAGVSYTPKTNADGLDRRANFGTGVFAPEVENALELALNGTRKFRESGVRIDAALAWSTADVSDRAGVAPYGVVETLSTGARIEQGDWSIGGSWLSSDNGLPNADYRAWSTGVSREINDTTLSLNYGEASDDGARIDTSSWQLGAGRDFGKDTNIALSYNFDEVEAPIGTSRSQGIVVEITLSTEILKFTGN